jgi:hypothetical protein
VADNTAAPAAAAAQAAGKLVMPALRLNDHFTSRQQ